MSRYKIKSSTLIIAALVILLCLASITGATLALFTSDPEDGKIGINATAGNVRVDIVDAFDSETSLVGDILNFNQGNVRFEPGATFYTQGFRVANIGNIPINFILYISEDTDLDDDFTDVFEVWITNDPVTETDAVKLQEYDGRLEVGQSSEVYYLVFRMKETADNRYQNRTFEGVGVTVCAVQGNINID